MGSELTLSRNRVSGSPVRFYARIVPPFPVNDDDGEDGDCD